MMTQEEREKTKNEKEKGGGIGGKFSNHLFNSIILFFYVLNIQFDV